MQANRDAGVTIDSETGDAAVKPSAIADLLRARPELAALYDQFADAFGRRPAHLQRLLALARLRIGQIHGCERGFDEASESVDAEDVERLAACDWAGFDHTERALLALVERVPFDHHGISDANVETCVGLVGEADFVRLLTAVSFFDVEARLHLVMNRVQNPPVDGITRENI